jgi:hypothetical protein
MKVLSIGQDSTSIELTKREARLVKNALNEVCNGLGLQDFQTRLGIDRNDARLVLKDFVALVREMSQT